MCVYADSIPSIYKYNLDRNVSAAAAAALKSEWPKTKGNKIST